MDKFTPPIFKPANFGVSSKDVSDLALKMRKGLTESKDKIGGDAAGSSGRAAPKAQVR